jgi:integrase
MPRKRSARIPKYRLHKPTGLAVVRLNGRDIYLGKHGSDQSHQRYEQVIAEWLANQRQLAVRREQRESTNWISVAELVLAYLEHAEAYYTKNGTPTGEYNNIRDSVRQLSKLYGRTLVVDFGPAQLKAVRQAMIRDDLCRNVINCRVNRIRCIFKWGVGNQLVPPDVLQALQAVDPLKRGRSEARDTEPIRPVPQHLIDKTLKHLPRSLQAMVRLQTFTGMRPGEVMSMRTGDLDVTGRIWVYRPGSPKTEHHGRSRVIFIGPKAQDVLRPFLKMDLAACVFTPADTVREKNTRLRAQRKSKVQPSQMSRAKPDPKLKPGLSYDRRAYQHAITRACAKAFPPPKGLKKKERAEWQRQHRWSPNQLRHNAATFLRKQFGIEAARVVLGHASQDVTEIYAELDLQRAADIMGQVG